MTEPIDPGQSKLILKALLEADWTKKEGPLQVEAARLFVRLGLKAPNGWMGPSRIEDVPARAKAVSPGGVQGEGRSGAPYPLFMTRA